MKYILIVITLVFMACKPTISQETPQPSLEKATVVSYRNLDVSGFNEAMKTEGTVLIDVRTPAEIADGKIEDAVELDFYDKDFADKLLAMDKNMEYLVYCKGGGRSAKAARLMIKNGFEKVNNLEGGYTAWKKDSQ